MAEIALNLDSQQVEAALLAAQILNEQGKWQSAIPFWRKALPGYPQDAELMSEFGFALYQAGNIQEASYFLEKATSYSPSDRSINHNYYLFLREHGTNEQIRAQLFHLQNFYPEATVLDLYLGQLAFAEQKYDTALQYLTLVSQKRPTWDVTYAELGDVYAAKGQQSLSIESYVKAIKLNPSKVIYKDKLIQALEERERERGNLDVLCSLKSAFPSIFDDLSAFLQTKSVHCQ